MILNFTFFTNIVLLFQFIGYIVSKQYYNIRPLLKNSDSLVKNLNLSAFFIHSRINNLQFNLENLVPNKIKQDLFSNYPAPILDNNATIANKAFPFKKLVQNETWVSLNTTSVPLTAVEILVIFFIYFCPFKVKFSICSIKRSKLQSRI